MIQLSAIQYEHERMCFPSITVEWYARSSDSNVLNKMRCGHRLLSGGDLDDEKDGLRIAPSSVSYDSRGLMAIVVLLVECFRVDGHVIFSSAADFPTLLFELASEVSVFPQPLEGDAV